jgi:hypothetical protein
MNQRHQLGVLTHETQPQPGQREIYRPEAKLSHLQRAAVVQGTLQPAAVIREVQS